MKIFFCLNFYPYVALGMYEIMHQFSCFTLCVRFEKVQTLLSSLKGDRQQKRLWQEKYLAAIHRYEAKAKMSSQTYLFQKQAKITKKFWKFASPLLIFELTSFKFQLPSTKAPLSLITTLLFRDFKDEHLSPVFAVLQLGTGS